MKEEIKQLLREKPILAERAEIEPALYEKIEEGKKLTDDDYNTLAKVLARKLKTLSGRETK